MRALSCALFLLNTFQKSIYAYISIYAYMDTKIPAPFSTALFTHSELISNALILDVILLQSIIFLTHTGMLILVA